MSSLFVRSVFVSVAVLGTGAVFKGAQALGGICNDNIKVAIESTDRMHKQALEACQTLPIEDQSSCRIDANIDKTARHMTRTSPIAFCQTRSIP